MRAVFLGFPIATGRLARFLGEKQDQVASWVVGMLVIVAIAVVLLGLARWQDVLVWFRANAP